MIALALAHLLDETPKAARRLLTIQPATEALRESYTDLAHLLDDDFENAIQRIRRAIPQNEDLRLCVIDLAAAACKGDDTQFLPPQVKLPHSKGQKADKN